MLFMLQKLTHQTSLLLSSFSEAVQIVACFLLFADRSGTNRGLQLLEPIFFEVWCVVRSEMLFCVPRLYSCLFGLLLPFCLLQPVWLTSNLLCSLASSGILCSVNARDGCPGKSQYIISVISEILRPAHLPHSKPRKSPFCSTLMLCLNINSSSWPCLYAYALSHVIGWLGICINKQPASAYAGFHMNMQTCQHRCTDKAAHKRDVSWVNMCFQPSYENIRVGGTIQYLKAAGSHTGNSNSKWSATFKLVLWAWDS